jgi:nucleotide-binding universal stress UspA family protein
MAPMSAAIARILIPTDYSETADRALDWAILQGKTFAAELTVLHVTPSHLHFGAIGFADQPEEGGPAKQRERLAAHVTPFVGDSGLTVRFLVEVGEPAIKIREVARRDQIDLIVMGTHGASRLGDLLFGSVAEKVVHHTGCPVLVVPPRSEAA